MQTNPHVWSSFDRLEPKHLTNVRQSALARTLSSSIDKQFDAAFPLSSKFAFFDDKKEKDLRVKIRVKKQQEADMRKKTLGYLAVEDRVSNTHGGGIGRQLFNNAMGGRGQHDLNRQTQQQQQETPPSSRYPPDLSDFNFSDGRTTRMPPTLLTDGGGFSIPLMEEKFRKRNRHAPNRASTVRESKFVSMGSLP
ncbi:hypothetical protein ScalyP_jg744 [Parmales sp. scaly parma]|nr:hypothetical protein ScalyP_jg744 [Parmales sp. scaly parma]